MTSSNIDLNANLWAAKGALRRAKERDYWMQQARKIRRKGKAYAECVCQAVRNARDDNRQMLWYLRQVKP